MVIADYKLRSRVIRCDHELEVRIKSYNLLKFVLLTINFDRG